MWYHHPEHQLASPGTECLGEWRTGSAWKFAWSGSVSRASGADPGFPIQQGSADGIVAVPARRLYDCPIRAERPGQACRCTVGAITVVFQFGHGKDVRMRVLDGSGEFTVLGLKLLER